MRILMLLMILACPNPAAGDWRRLPSLPDKEGFAGAYAGVSGDALLVAGGANFPDKKPWEGGTKVWTDTIFVLEKPDGDWQVAGRLPRPLGYGVSVTHRGGVICVGGSDATRHYPDAFRLHWKAGRLIITDLPPLPVPIANACGALVGDHLYIAGGQSAPDAPATLRSVHRLDLSARKPAWHEIAPIPGNGRMLAVAAGFEGAFYVSGGADLILNAAGKPERRYLKDAFRFDPRQGWRRIADLPRPAVAAPSPAPTGPSGFFILGGDDGAQLGIAPAQHRGFAKSILCYDAKADRWIPAGDLPAPRVTTPCTRWNGGWVVPSGEARPGIRSPEVWCWTPQ